MASIQTLASRMWNDPLIKIPTESSREGIDKLKSNLESWNNQGNMNVTESKDHFGNITLEVKFENAPTRPLGKTSRAFYVKPYIENFLESEFKKLLV